MAMCSAGLCSRGRRPQSQGPRSCPWKTPKCAGSRPGSRSSRPASPLPSVLLEGISDKVTGAWSLWRIALRAKHRSSHRMMPLFISEEGRLLAPTARAVWDRLIDLDGSTPTADTAPVTGDDAMATYERARIEAERQGEALFSELMAAHRESQDRQWRKGRRAFEARRKTVERIGLPEVRNHRLRELEREEAEWRQRLAQQDAVVPELTALLMLRVARSEATT